jgi:hypothetical protein
MAADDKLMKAAEQAARQQLQHRLAKQQRLLDSLANEDDALVAQVMRAFPGMTREEAREELRLHGGL